MSILKARLIETLDAKSFNKAVGLRKKNSNYFNLRGCKNSEVI
jgi:hypothetical protein